MLRIADTSISGVGTRLRLWLKRPSPAFTYGGAILLAALAQAARLPLHPPTLMPFITYVPFILLSAAFGGLGPGLLSTNLCILETVLFAIEPIGSLRVADPRNWLGIGALALTGLVASVLFERLKRSEERQRAANLELATVQRSAPVILLVVDDALRVRKANDLAVQFAGRNVSEILGLGPGGAIGCLNALADPAGCGHGPACGECAIRLAISDTLRNGIPHSGVEAWVPLSVDGCQQTRCLQVSTVPMQPNGSGRTALICAQDITERKQAEVELREQRDALQRQAALIDLSHDAIITADENLVITGWNTGAAELYGWTEADALGNVMHQFFQTSATISTGTIGEILSRAGRWDGELEHSRRDATRLTVDSRQVQLRDSEGNPAGILEINRDITERKRAEEALRESEERFRAQVTASSDAVYRMNPDWSEMRQLQGRDFIADTETPSLTWIHKYIHPDDQPRVLAAIDKAIRAKSIFELEHRVLRVDGTLGWTFSRAIPLRDANGEIFEWLGAASDITERKQAEVELREQRDALQRQAELIDLSHDAIVAQNENRVITGWNMGAQEMYGWTEAEAVGNVTDEFLQTSATISTGAINEILNRVGRWDGELEHFRRDGTRLTVESRQVLLRDPYGNPTGILEVNRDITERKQAGEEIQRLNADLEQRVQDRTAQLAAANQELEAFAYSVSHDLRGPLRHVEGFLGLLEDHVHGGLDEKGRHYLHTVLDSAKHMGGLIDDLLHFSRSGRVEMHWTRVGMADLLKQKQQEITLDLGERKVVWRVAPLPEVTGDPTLLGQVLVNLLGNAIKYTRGRAEAAIDIGCREEGLEWVFFVRDNGAGFDMRYADKLFGVFQRLHSSSEFEGTGIGLANVRRIISRHGGRTWAEGVVGRGATFYFSLPKGAGEEKSGSPGEQFQTAPTRKEHRS